jgi:hypothetical protein
MQQSESLCVATGVKNRCASYQEWATEHVVAELDRYAGTQWLTSSPRIRAASLALGAVRARVTIDRSFTATVLQPG